MLNITIDDEGQVTVGKATAVNKQSVASGVQSDVRHTDVRHPFVPGNRVFIRTVTYHSTGEVVGVVDGFVLLKDAAWVADSGRFSETIKTGALNEVEPVEEMYVALGSVVDVFPWEHELPRTRK